MIAIVIAMEVEFEVEFECSPRLRWVCRAEQSVVYGNGI